MNLFEVLKEIEKVSGKGAIMQGVEVKDIERIALDSFSLTRMLYGGIPKGRMIEFSGPEASGKTTTALLAIAGYQRQDDRPALFIDAEGTYDPRWAALLGVDNSKKKFIKWTPENMTAEEVFEYTLKVAKTDEVGMIVLDSLAVLVPQQEEAKKMSEYQMGGISKPLSVFVRKLQALLLKNNTITFIGINQVRDNMSQYGPPTVTVGGRAWRHACSIRMEFKSENVDEGGNYISDTAENPPGVRIISSLKKNKTAPRNRKLGSYVIYFDGGFDPKLDIIANAADAGIIKRSGSYFRVVDYSTGEIVLNVQGRKGLYDAIQEEHLQMLKEELYAIDKPDEE